jgi:hypothetical protein
MSSTPYLPLSSNFLIHKVIHPQTLRSQKNPFIVFIKFFFQLRYLALPLYFTSGTNLPITPTSLLGLKRMFVFQGVLPHNGRKSSISFCFQFSAHPKSNSLRVFVQEIFKKLD